MAESCELYDIIPRHKLDIFFEKYPQANAELDYTFLGFEEVYKAATLFVPKDTIIIDLGCGYALQSWYFKDYKKYIGVDMDINITHDSAFCTDNSEFYHMTIQRFIQYCFPKMGIDKKKVFAICSYVPDESARQEVKKIFPYCLCYYP